MTTYEDLTPYDYFPDQEGDVRNVGWLGKESRFPTGEAEPGLVAALVTLAAFHHANGTRGFHRCELCGPRTTRDDYEPTTVPFEFAARGEVMLGSAEIHVPGRGGVIYAAPNLVVHYVETHGYEPPADFVRSALAEAAASNEAWERVKRDLPVGGSVRGEVLMQYVSGTEISLHGFPELTGLIRTEDAAGVPDSGALAEAVVAEHLDRGRRIVLRLR